MAEAAHPVMGEDPVLSPRSAAILQAVGCHDVHQMLNPIGIDEIPGSEDKVAMSCTEQ